MSREKYLEVIHHATITYCHENNLFFRVLTDSMDSKKETRYVNFYDSEESITPIFCEGFQPFGSIIYDAFKYLGEDYLKKEGDDWATTRNRQIKAVKRYIAITYQYIKYGVPFDIKTIQQTILFGDE